MACVYKHIRLDTGNVFYIGIGRDKNRPYTKRGRNVYWGRVAAKHGYKANIVLDGLSWKDALSWEIYLIGLYGRINNNTGHLVNQTAGGEGMVGFVHSEESKKKISEAKKNISNETRAKMAAARRGVRASEETRRKYSASRSGVNNPRYGKKASEETKRRIGSASLGRVHSEAVRAKYSLDRLGSKNVNAKKVINTSSGAVYGYIGEAAEVIGVKRTTLTSWLNGTSRNKSTLKFL